MSAAGTSYPGAQPSVRGVGEGGRRACCLNIGFRHIFSVSDCVTFDVYMFRVAEERETTMIY